MASSGPIRWGAIGLILGGVTWLVLGLSARFGYLQAIPGREDVWLFVVSLPLSVYRTALFGLILVVLGYGLSLHRGAATGQPSRVR